MLTKEFAQRVELSEKQVRKIVQHLEEQAITLVKQNIVVVKPQTLKKMTSNYLQISQQS